MESKRLNAQMIHCFTHYRLNKNYTDSILITRWICIFDCNALNATFWGGNERRELDNSNDTTINQNDGNDGILHVI